MNQDKLAFMMKHTGKTKEEILKMEEDINNLSPEEINKLEEEAKEKQKMLTEMLPALMASQVSMKESGLAGMANIIGFGEKARQYCEKFKCSMQQFLMELRFVHQNFIKQYLDIGCHFDEDVHKISPKDKEKNRANYQKINSGGYDRDYSRPQKPKGMTIGNILKAKK